MIIMKLKYSSLPPDVSVYNHKSYSDLRGSLTCIHETNDPLNINGCSTKLSKSRDNVARGMHWQNKNCPQKKIITLLHGSIIDFLLNVDVNSTEFGKFYAYELKSSDKLTLSIPDHYAHGFLTLEETTFFYKCDGRYSPSNEISINIIDLISTYTDLNIDGVLLSSKDKNAPKLNELTFI
mgnify:CR=1 FL=1